MKLDVDSIELWLTPAPNEDAGDYLIRAIRALKLIPALCAEIRTLTLAYDAMGDNINNLQTQLDQAELVIAQLKPATVGGEARP